MKQFIVVMLVATLTGTACSPYGEEGEQPSVRSVKPLGEVQLIAEPLSQVYPTTGPLMVRVTILNGTGDEFVFRPILDFGAFLDADVVDVQGGVLPRMMDLDPPNAREVRLGRGQVYSDTVDLRCSMLVAELGECLEMYDLSVPGTYEVRMRFSAPCDPPHCTGAHERLDAEPFLIEIRQ